MSFQVLRVAKHTRSIKKMKTFYCERLGFKVLGTFENHQGYNGIFLGFEDANWHIEFTESEDQPVRNEDPDDMMVFYCQNESHFKALEESFCHDEVIRPKNPYWVENGLLILDPDGNKIVISKC
jgi:catechol 2,3-dioxygenase-like lactoylglutathione lyase family enzyme